MIKESTKREKTGLASIVFSLVPAHTLKTPTEKKKKKDCMIASGLGPLHCRFKIKYSIFYIIIISLR